MLCITLPFGPCIRRLPCSAPHCQRHATTSLTLARATPHPFCLEHHAHALAQLRELVRFDALLNKLLLVTGKWYMCDRTLGSTQLPNGTLVLWRGSTSLLRAANGGNVSPVSVRIRDIAVCFNSCIVAMRVLAGVLAYLGGEAWEAEEIDFRGALASQRIMFVNVDCTPADGAPRIHAESLAQKHSMFQLSSELLGRVMLDPTAPQYGHAQGWRFSDDYPDAYRDAAPRVRELCRPSRQRYGQAYVRHRVYVESWRAGRVGSANWPAVCLAVVRHTNNIVYERVEEAGGPQVVRSADDETWLRIEGDIVDRIENRMRTLMAEVEELEGRGYTGERRREGFWELVTASQGPGNIALVKLLSVVYGDELLS
ncbi:hypothetical protein C7974DRAFT_418741 [Boeremia exigua]|uniref:uncharacterized protein n=1 Tax=Boeremia exigua TaxID=749465 RepID=UPI001E8CE7CC|nr:uncharacterized protein C7974DRAFT_418741 [Boeremia exigua]KAH6611828.1 hypothetical protein C7974DRAFT_418741 [Boeremia exigua]